MRARDTTHGDVGTPLDLRRLGLSPDLREAIEEAEDLAFDAGQVPGSGHLLLAFLTTKNRAERFLRELGLDEDRLLDHLAVVGEEPKGAVRTIMERAAHVAAVCGSDTIETLHVLVGLTRVRESAAHALLERAGERLPRLRTRALTLLTGSRPRWRRVARKDAEAPPHVGRHHLSLRPIVVQPPEPPPEGKVAAPSPRLEPPGGPSSPRAQETRPVAGGHEVSGERSAERGARPQRARDPARALEPPAGGQSGASARALVPSIRQVRREGALERPEREGEAPRALEADPGAAFELAPEDFPWLSSLGRNLSAEAARGELDVLVGREAEVEQLIDILGKRRANNPCLVGEPGVGKTAIVEGLAARWASGGPADRRRIVIGLDAGRLLVGTHLRGSFSEKLRGLQDEVKRSAGRVLIFFDELHTLVGAGASGEGANDAANELKAALARGDFPCIGATTPGEFARHIAKDPALERRFMPILVTEPSPERAEAMLYRILPAYSDHHGVGFTPEAVRASIRLSVRFLPEQHLPDKAIALLDLAGSRAARSKRSEVMAEDVGRLVSERTGIPLERLMATDRERLLGLEEALSGRLVGHRPALRRIAEVLLRHAAGFRSQRPQGSFLLVGPSGVGKTETAKALAEVLHGDESTLIRFDFSEFGETHAVARLVGAPPGYVGHDSGGQLTEAVRRRPACVILFDEIDKAHRDVLQVLLQVLDDGRLTDGHGRTVSFSETIIVLTSNLGVEALSPRPKIGFQGAGPSAPPDLEALAIARQSLLPELWARIDEKLWFPPLEREEVRQIARLLAARSSDRLERERGITFELDGRAIDLLLEHGGYDLALGARPLRRILGHLVEAPIAARILEGRLHAGEHVKVSRQPGGGLVFRVGGEPRTLSRRPWPPASPRG